VRGTNATFLDLVVRPPDPGWRGPASLLSQKTWQLGEVYSDPPSLVLGEQVGRRASARLVLEVEIAERLTVLVADDEAGVVVLFERSRRREAAWGWHRVELSASHRSIRNKGSDEVLGRFR
jgi:hypothetical protein